MHKLRVSRVHLNPEEKKKPVLWITIMQSLLVDINIQMHVSG